MKKLSSVLSGFSRPVDLTNGTPWKVILRFAVPIIVSYFLQQVYVLADAIICGQVLTSAEVAGVNDTFPLTFIFLQFAFGCTAGFSVLTARYVGQNDAAGVRKSFATQVYLTLVISAVLTVLSLVLLPWMLQLIHVTPENPEVYQAAYRYCFFLFLGIVAQMGYNFVCGILRAYGDSVTPLVFLVLSTLLNIGLDLLFLLVWKSGPAGAAIATVLAQLVSVAACTVYTFVKYPELRLHAEDFHIGKAWVSHLREGVPLGLQFSVLAIGIIVMQSAVVRFDLTPAGVFVAGTPAQNGFGAANKLINFLMDAFNGLGSAILGYHAQNYGKCNYERIRKGTLQTLGMMLIVVGVCLLVGGLLSVGGAYQYIFMSADKVSPESIHFGNVFLFVDLAFYAVLGFLIVIRSAVQGIFLPAYVLGAGIAELVARILICAFLPVAVNGGAIDSTASSLAFAAVCFGDPGAWLCGSAVLCVPFFRFLLQKKYPTAKESAEEK